MAKEKQLPFGQITPVAKPLGAFIVPGQKQTAGAAKPSMIGSVPQIAAIQKGSQGNVQGYNQFQQLAQALGPFTTNLVQAGTSAYLDYGRRKIESGYEDVIKNELAKAKLSLQIQEETSAGNVAAKIGALWKIDQEAAELLKSSHPFELTGRRRALSQLAASEIDNLYNDDLANNAAQLSTIKPGDPQLTKRRYEIQKQIQDKYGLTGDEKEYQFYVVPKENRAYDKYTNEHKKLWDATLQYDTKNKTVKAITALVDDYSKNGIFSPLIEGNIPMTDPRFIELAAGNFTKEIDQALSLFGGQDKIDVWKDIQKELAAYMDETPIADAIRNIRVGSPDMDWDSRPLFGDTNPGTVLELESKALERKSKLFENKQKGFEITGAALYWGADGPSSYPVGSQKWKDRIKELFTDNPRFEEWLDMREWLNDQRKIEDKNEEFLESDDAITTERKISQFANGLTPEAIKDSKTLYESIRTIAEAAAPSERPAVAKRLNQAVSEYRTELEKLPEGTRTELSAIAKEVLALPDIKAIEVSGTGTTEAMLFGSSMANESLEYQRFYNDVLDALTVEYNRLLTDWRKKNPDEILGPTAKTQIKQEARTNLFKKDPSNITFQEIYKRAVGEEKMKAYFGIKDPVPPSGPTDINPASKLDRKGGDSGERTPPETDRGGNDFDDIELDQKDSFSLPTHVIKTYESRAIINGRFIYSELTSFRESNSYSDRFIKIAERAGVHPDRLMLEQLKFYDKTLDPDGNIKRFLLERINSRKENSTVSSAYMQQSGSNWLANMLFGGPASASEITMLNPRSKLLTGTDDERWQAAMSLATELGAKYPEVIAAQFAKESGFGRKPSGTHNYFGLKGLKGGNTTLTNTEEDNKQGKSTKTKDYFINFDSPRDAFKYLIDRWYKDYKGYIGVESGGNPQKIAELLQEQGYATDPNYAKALKTLLKERSNLSTLPRS
tara:strand:+ start:3278 stop:6136 length:2859 start_codon:yes stop_codon:yes gene_type:complete